jgi:hypothetical protein
MKSNWPILISALFFFTSCKENPETFAIHSPIYPGSSQAVTFNLRQITGSVDNVKLYEFVATIASDGSLSATTPETLLQDWSSPVFPVTFTKTAGYAANRLVTYRFVVTGNGKAYTHRISFATRPYPVANMPAPVYITGDQDRLMNLVFIPDTDVNIDTFYNAVYSDIRDAFQAEDWVRRFRSSHNFYINPLTGHAHDYDTETRDHEEPTNWGNLSFAQGKVILHQRSIRDFAQGGGLFSTEHYNRGTILHESGHSLYGMADEYPGGVHWENDDFPNTWPDQTAAQNFAPSIGMVAADANKIGTSDSWWELCTDDCMMERTGLNVSPYRKPCQMRILWAILQRSSGN